jgi:hypothetical protein
LKGLTPQVTGIRKLQHGNMDKLNLDKKNLKKFGITMGIVFLAITAILSAKHNTIVLPALLVSLAFFVLAALAARLLGPIYIVWMKFARILEWVNTRIILSVIFYLIFTPLGLVMKLLGKDLLDRRIEGNKDSYWHKKENKGFNLSDYERQF